MKKALLLLMASTFLTYGAEKKTEAEKGNDKKTQTTTEKIAGGQTNGFRYNKGKVLPIVGTAVNRLDGGSRGDTENLPELYVIAPDHTGLTTKAQPTLFWFQSKPTTVKMLVTLIATNDISPILKTKVDGNEDKRFRSIDLARYKDIRLEEGKEYEWFVATARSGKTTASDIVAGGRLMRVKPSDTLNQKLADPAGGQKPAIYAGEGIWYDAIDALFQEIEAHSNDPELVKQRDTLLQDVGLTKIVSMPAAK